MRCFWVNRFGGSGAACFALLLATATAQPVSFRNDVMAVISKAGCNAGTCHGNANGKAGFKLSLRGEDPEVDFQAFTRDIFGRRTDPLNPDQSLILLKATAQIAHEGGARFRKDSPEYKTLRTWLAVGMPNDIATAPKVDRLEVAPSDVILLEPTNRVQLTAHALFSDGARRDVSSLAVYDPSSQMIKVDADGLVTASKPGEVTVIVRFLERQAPVRLAFVSSRPNFVWSNPKPRNIVDEHVFAKLCSLRMNPSDLCTDSEFVRRAYLDVIGLLPTAGEARAFVADKRKDKRAQLVDALLKRPEFADFWALKWADLLRNEEKVLDRKGVQLFYRWIRQSIAAEKPLDQFARELLSARGSTYAQPAGNYLRALRDPITRAESTAQVFLGTRLQCAKCHNHPFDRWTQSDYYDWAEVFTPVGYKVLENNRRDGLDKHEFNGEQIVWAGNEKPVMNPKTAKAAHKRFLGDMEADRSEALAQWITEQPMFARSQVNRIWFNLMGRGIVDPIDDFRPTNPPSHPELLDALANEFVNHKYSLRHIIRLIMNSRTYQLSSLPNETNRDDESNFSRGVVQRLSAEQLLDAQSQVTGVPLQFTGYPAGMRATQLPGVRAVRTRERKPSDEDQFLTTFGKPMRLLTCECERSSETSMGQAFHLISGPTINDFLTTPDNRLSKLLASGKSDAAIVVDLYWSALSRPPSKAESAKATSLLTETSDRRAALEDLTWALLNAKEFVLRK
jgi:uncharacterized protein DUF1549/uncharacterized protein DUF1553